MTRFRILERPPSQDIARPDALALPASTTASAAPVGSRRRFSAAHRPPPGRSCRAATAQSLDGRGHGVGGVHAAAAPRYGALCARLPRAASSLILPAGRARTDRLEHRDDVDPDAEGSRPRPDGAPIDEDRTGRFSRAIAMPHPGMFLSQPPMATKPSKALPSDHRPQSAPAITSRETSEYRMPGEPIAMPSETAMAIEEHAPCRPPHRRRPPPRGRARRCACCKVSNWPRSRRCRSAAWRSPHP